MVTEWGVADKPGWTTFPFHLLVFFQSIDDILFPQPQIRIWIKDNTNSDLENCDVKSSLDKFTSVSLAILLADPV